MRKCTVCNEEIHPKRVEILPNTQTCVKHSTVEKKVAVTVQMGEGDHTWIETFAVEREEYDKLAELEKHTRKTTPEAYKMPSIGLEEEEEEIDEQIVVDLKNKLNLDDILE
jgi:RNA polymerase-binding transcription factor DksA